MRIKPTRDRPRDIVPVRAELHADAGRFHPRCAGQGQSTQKKEAG